MSDDQIIGLMTGFSALLSASVWLARIYLRPQTYVWLSRAQRPGAPS